MDLAVEACGDKYTITGEPEISMLCLLQGLLQGRWDLGLTSIITALLHDSYNNLKSNSKGAWKRNLVKRLLKYLMVFQEFHSIDSMQSSYQAENFRKLLLSLADDVRVILIKLVERLEYMRNLDNAPEKDRLPLASETYFLYAPLAHRLGFL